MAAKCDYGYDTVGLYRISRLLMISLKPCKIVSGQFKTVLRHSNIALRLLKTPQDYVEIM